MVKLLLFSPLALENGRGGEISIIELAEGLQNLNEITLIDTNVLPGKKLLTSEIIRIKLKGVKRTTQIRYATLNIYKKIISFPYPGDIIKLLKLIKLNDIVYFSESTIKTDLLFLLFSILHRRGKFIIGYRKPISIEKKYSLYNLKYRASILFFSLFKKRFYHHTISKYTKDFLENFYNPEKITHIIHGVDLNKYIDDLDYKKNKNTLNFIYVGHLDKEHKGIDILISAIEGIFKENKKLNIHFEFCGAGPLEIEVKKLELRYPERIIYNGYVRNDKIHEYYRKNDVFLFTSRREPFGRVIIEALAAKLFVICSKTIGSIEILRDQEFAFFLPRLSSEYIKEKIYEIYNLWSTNPKRYRELQESAKDYAFKNYSLSIELEMFNLFTKRILKT